MSITTSGREARDASCERIRLPPVSTVFDQIHIPGKAANRSGKSAAAA